MFWRLLFGLVALVPLVVAGYIMFPIDRQIVTDHVTAGGVTLSRYLVLLGRNRDDTTLRHERVHQRQIRGLGPFLIGELRFFWRWFRDPAERLRLEAEGFAPELAYIVYPYPPLRAAYVNHYALIYRANYDGKFGVRKLGIQVIRDAFWLALNAQEACNA